MQATEVKRPTGRIFYGWWIVLAGNIMRTVSGTFTYYGFGAFFNPLVAQFNAPGAAVAAALSIARLEQGALGPLAGFMFDRFGPRRMMFFGVLLTGTGFLLLSRADSLLYFYIVFIVMISGGASFGVGGGGTDVAIANWFRRKRGRAMGFATLGLSFGGILVIPLAWYIDTFGWRSALVLAGIITITLGLPLASVVRHRPEPYGYLPDGDPPKTVDPPPAAATAVAVEDPPQQAIAVEEEEEVNFSPLQALRTSAFWAITLTVTTRRLVTPSVAVFLIPFLEERGMSTTAAATVLGAMALAGAPGRVVFGWLGDIFPKRYVMAGCFAFQSAGLVLLNVFDGFWGIALFLLLYAPTYAGVLPLIPAIQGEYFGAKWFGTIRGMMAPITLVSAVGGPVFTATVFDLTGSYEPAFLILAFVSLLALALILSARRPARQP